MTTPTDLAAAMAALYRLREAVLTRGEMPGADIYDAVVTIRAALEGRVCTGDCHGSIDTCVHCAFLRSWLRSPPSMPPRPQRETLTICRTTWMTAPEEPWCWGPGSPEHETNQCLHNGRPE